MITRTVRVPKTLVDEIDKRIDSQEYSTRADFILHAMRQMLTVFASKKKEMIEAASPNYRITEERITELFNSLAQSYLKGFDEYGGEMMQINTRVPEGLEDKTMILMKPEYGFKKKTDYTRASIICLLSVLRETDDSFEDAEKLIAKQRQMTETVNKVIIEGLSKGMTAKEILDAAYEKLKDTETGAE
ncbi:MAG: hypothetical protein IKQ60_04825 [Candidatus Methanomethylophilaceae archaeon]|nr:hypothetical protein [Candidatus Methanomethylophilaceae archaeon]